MFELNVCNLNCPLPVLKAKKFLATLESGDMVKIISTDPGSRYDLQDFCHKTGNTLISQNYENGQIITIIKRR